jgi:choline-phosphate cytidylyltransferase
VAHDDIPYQSGDHSDVYEFVKKTGRFVATNRTEGVSTSELITRIVRDYDKYVRRNLERGVSAKELNLSYLKATELQIKHNAAKIASSISKKITEGERQLVQSWKEGKEELLPESWRQTLDQWEASSQDWIRSFGGMFRRRNSTVTAITPTSASPSKGNESA